jgi:hypothetical protein
MAKAKWLHPAEVLHTHIETLCRNEEIVWCVEPRRGGWSAGTFREIGTPPICGPISYAVALHEIGHCLGRNQLSRKVMVRERAAWAWARRYALIWTPAMERRALKSLEWHELHAQYHRRSIPLR